MKRPKKLISELALLVGLGYGFEALLLFIGWLRVPGLGPLLGITQIPSIAWAINQPPGPAPDGQRGLLVFMFLVQGFIFSAIAIVVWFRFRRRNGS